jgi:hypothetical protein
MMTVPASLLAQLKDFMEKGSDWSELETPIPGVFIVKPKAKKDDSPSLMLEIRPTSQDGLPSGRSKLFVRNRETLTRLQESVTHDKILALIEAIESLNTPVNTNNKASQKKKLSF